MKRIGTASLSRRIADVSLTARGQIWHPPAHDRTAVEEHWLHRSAENPTLFNGIVYVLTDWRIERDVMKGVLAPINFKDFLYWSDQGKRDTGFLDCHGSAILTSKEGHVLLGQAAGHTLSGGMSSFVSGFIDRRDVLGCGTVDIDGSTLRELEEETGLTPELFDRVPGYRVTQDGPVLSIGIEYRARLSAQALRARILAAMKLEAEPELSEVHVVRSTEDLARIRVRGHAAVATRALLAGT
jgi:NUDIX domain